MKQNQKNKAKYIILHWVIVLTWILCIFAFSSQPAENSNSLSLRVTRIIIKATDYVLPIYLNVGTIDGIADKYNGVIRKIAHGTIYLILGIVVTRTFRISGIRGKKAYILALLFCFVYSSSDELHQILVAGRSGQISDVLLDTGGAGLGIGLYRLVWVLVLGNWKSEIGIRGNGKTV